jgi:small membrane protein
VQIIVQIVLVLAVVVMSLALMRGGSNARHLAIRRIMLVLFALVAAFSIFFPELLTRVARLLGIGRGTDLVLYGLVVSFLVFMATTYQRFRHMEATLTKLSRRIALDEVGPPSKAEAPQSEGTQNHRRLTPPAPGGQ